MKAYPWRVLLVPGPKKRWSFGKSSILVKKKHAVDGSEIRATTVSNLVNNGIFTISTGCFGFLDHQPYGNLDHFNRGG